MSIISEDIRSAISFNKKNPIDRRAIPKNVLMHYPWMGEDHDTVEFANEVMRYQSEHGLKADGKLGKITWSHILNLFTEGWMLNGKRVICNAPIIGFDQPGGLDLHPSNKYSVRAGSPSLVVVHWGGLNPKNCFDVFVHDERKVSSHAGIGFGDRKGDARIYQYLDLKHTSWHAGFVNKYSVGIDICQQPEIKWKDYYLSRGYDIHEMENRTSRGPNKVLSLDPRIRDATRDAVQTLCDLLDIPMRYPKGHDIMSSDELKSFRGVVGHHHISQNKWDIACWWSDIFGDVHV